MRNVLTAFSFNGRLRKKEKKWENEKIQKFHKKTIEIQKFHKSPNRQLISAKFSPTKNLMRLAVFLVMVELTRGTSNSEVKYGSTEIFDPNSYKILNLQNFELFELFFSSAASVETKDKL